MLLASTALVGARPPTIARSIEPHLRLSEGYVAGLHGARAALPGARGGLAENRLVVGPPAAAPGDSAPATGPAGEPAAPSPPLADEGPGPVAEAPPEPPPPEPEPPAAEPPPPPPPEPPAPPEPTPPSAPPPPPAAEPMIEAGFENGLDGWNTAGVGDTVPRIASDIVRDGDKASAVRLTGEQGRSELILGGSGTGSTAGTVRFREGDEYWYAFSFYIKSMVYGEPGAHNLIMQFKSPDEGSPAFGLQLWDYAGDDGRSGGRGLWSHGAAMGGDRFLAPVPEQTWHDVLVHFKASSAGAGFYEVFLDGRPIDSRDGVSMIVPGQAYAYIKEGLYRNGGELAGTSELRLDSVRLGTTRDSVLPPVAG